MIEMEHLFNNILQKNPNLNPYIMLETCQMKYMRTWRKCLM